MKHKIGISLPEFFVAVVDAEQARHRLTKRCKAVGWLWAAVISCSAISLFALIIAVSYWYGAGVSGVKPRPNSSLLFVSLQWSAVFAVATGFGAWCWATIAERKRYDPDPFSLYDKTLTKVLYGLGSRLVDSLELKGLSLQVVEVKDPRGATEAFLVVFEDGIRQPIAYDSIYSGIYPYFGSAQRWLADNDPSHVLRELKFACEIKYESGRITGDRQYFHFGRDRRFVVALDWAMNDIFYGLDSPGQILDVIARSPIFTHEIPEGTPKLLGFEKAVEEYVQQHLADDIKQRLKDETELSVEISLEVVNELVEDIRSKFADLGLGQFKVTNLHIGANIETPTEVKATA